MTQDAPPERDFDQAQAYPLLEEIVADTVETLPDFPGFYQRMYYPVEDCGHLGEAYKGWVAIEIAYGFSAEDSLTDTVRRDYTAILRDQWTEAGYEIHRDTIDPETGNGSLEAKRPDGINLWWGVHDGASLSLQTGCIPPTEGFEKPDYISPAGGVAPENDHAVNSMKPPTDEESKTQDPSASSSDG